MKKMSVEIWNLEKDLCRCCHAEGSFDNLAEPKKYLQSEEIYSDMLKNCFNIEIVPVPGEMCAMTYKICEACISRLRYALSFKKQVQACEEKFLDLYNKNAIRVLNKNESTKLLPHTIVKEEASELFLIDFEEEDFPHIDNDTDEDYRINEDVETDMDIKPESGHQLEVQTEPSDSNDCDLECYTFDDHDDTGLQDDDKNDTIDGEAELLARFPHGYRLPTRKTLYTRPCKGFAIHLDRLRGKNIFPKMVAKLLEDDSENSTRKKMYVTEKMAQIQNTTMVIEYSNVTVFKSKNRVGFPCFYCRSPFENFDMLRKHQAKAHKKSETRKIVARYGTECLVVYADITDLKCLICEEKLANLNELKAHLIKVHDKKIHTEFTDRVIPFKLSNNKHPYECQSCGCNFETFGSIERHMNAHYRNYVCIQCGTGFVTKYRLKTHIKSMHVGGNFPCEVCKKVFTTHQKHKNHVDTVHKMVKRFKCPKCPERFSEYFRRQKHLVESHGSAPLRYKCNVCDKAFDRRYTLSRHMKRDHLEERDFQCQLCAYKCFTKDDLRMHMIKHIGERIHECSVCKKAYARKNTLREHMRIHNNDRRFSCAVCGQAFVQKCSLKGHIKTHHLDYNLP